jgi:hypothetical protein
MCVSQRGCSLFTHILCWHSLALDIVSFCPYRFLIFLFIVFSIAGSARQPVRHVRSTGSLPARRHLHQHGHGPGLRVQKSWLRRTFLWERWVLLNYSYTYRSPNELCWCREHANDYQTWAFQFDGRCAMTLTTREQMVNAIRGSLIKTRDLRGASWRIGVGGCCYRTLQVSFFFLLNAERCDH